jgi:hypothetical protein
MKTEEKLPEIRVSRMSHDTKRRLEIWKAYHPGQTNRDILIALLEQFLDDQGIK